LKIGELYLWLLLLFFDRTNSNSDECPISTINATWKYSKTHLEVSLGWIFMLKKAAIIHCIHPSHSMPLQLPLIITLNKYKITLIVTPPLTRRGLHFNLQTATAW
jgi:hypothetical protein